MAVSTDRVYQKVLALANKEQRGYITPQEFNLFADQAQMEIFDQYFYDLNQFKRQPGKNIKYSDTVSFIEEKIAIFKSTKSVTNGLYGGVFPYKIDSIYDTGSNSSTACVVEEINQMKATAIQSSPLTKATSKRPVYYTSNRSLFFIPEIAVGTYTANIILRPKIPIWPYSIVNTTAMYNPGSANSQNFELHPSEENNLVVKILQLSGVAMKDYQLAQVASQVEMKNTQQEKQ